MFYITKVCKYAKINLGRYKFAYKMSLFSLTYAVVRSLDIIFWSVFTLQFVAKREVTNKARVKLT